MNAEQQRIAIAQVRGWKHIKTLHDANGVTLIVGFPPSTEAREECIKSQCDPEIPPIDLNAMHEAEEILHSDYEKSNIYSYRLERVVYKTKHSGIGIGFAILNATAAQRAEAFLRTLNLWKD